MGGRGGCKVALPGSLPLKGGGSKDLPPQNIVGGLCPGQKEFFCVCCDWGIAGVVSAFTVHCCL